MLIYFLMMSLVTKKTLSSLLMRSRYRNQLRTTLIRPITHRWTLLLTPFMTPFTHQCNLSMTNLALCNFGTVLIWCSCLLLFRFFIFAFVSSVSKRIITQRTTSQEILLMNLFLCKLLQVFQSTNLFTDFFYINYE